MKRKQQRLRRLSAPGLVLAVLLLAGTPSWAVGPPERSGAGQLGRAAFDLVVLRPLQLVRVAVSAAVFVPAYPVSFLFDGDEDVLDACIKKPAEQAFERPLGDL